MTAASLDRYHKSTRTPPRDRSQADARARAKITSELWLDVYQSALEAFLHAREPGTDATIGQCVDDARLTADKAVDTYEERWAGVRV